MKKIISSLLGAVIVLTAGCSKENTSAMRVRIAPVITRVTGVHFDRDDRIGLTITRNSTPFVENTMMTYDGSVFSGAGLVWYNDLNEKSTLTAYYPYSAQGQPAEFTIAADQRAGCTSSDLLAAVKTEVKPTSSAIGMLFHHLLSQVTIVVTNTSQGRIESVSLGGFVPTAEVDYANMKTVAKSGAAAVETIACEMTPDAVYRVVLVPQQTDLIVTVRTDDGKSHSKTIPAALLEGGKQYDMSMSVTDIDLDVALSGDIQDWVDGGTLGEDNSGSGETLSYEGEVYRTQIIGGKRWMAENMRHVPGGAAVGSGIWYPCRDLGACSDPGYIKDRGMLYDFALASGGAAKAGRNAVVQGICPPGWHIPNTGELTMLVESEFDQSAFFSLAGFWIAGLAKYQNESKGNLIGAELSEDKTMVTCLRCAAEGIPTIGMVIVENGMSLRCVEDDK